MNLAEFKRFLQLLDQKSALFFTWPQKKDTRQLISKEKPIWQEFLTAFLRHVLLITYYSELPALPHIATLVAIIYLISRAPIFDFLKDLTEL